MAVGDDKLQEEFADYYHPQNGNIEAVTPTMIAKQVKSTTKAVTKSLTNMGFRIEKRNIKLHKKDENGNMVETRRTQRLYVVETEKDWRGMVSRYYYDEDDTNADVQIPDILKHSKFVCAETSQVSQVSQEGVDEQGSVTGVTLVTGGNTRETGNVEQTPDVLALLGMSIDQALAIWRGEGSPVIYLGAGENCTDLSTLLNNVHMKPEHLQAINEWLVEHKEIPI